MQFVFLGGLVSQPDEAAAAAAAFAVAAGAGDVEELRRRDRGFDQPGHLPVSVVVGVGPTAGDLSPAAGFRGQRRPQDAALAGHRHVHQGRKGLGRKLGAQSPGDRLAQGLFAFARRPLVLDPVEGIVAVELGVQVEPVDDRAAGWPCRVARATCRPCPGGPRAASRKGTGVGEIVLRLAVVRLGESLGDLHAPLVQQRVVRQGEVAGPLAQQVDVALGLLQTVAVEAIAVEHRLHRPRN